MLLKGLCLWTKSNSSIEAAPPYIRESLEESPQSLLESWVQEKEMGRGEKMLVSCRLSCLKFLSIMILLIVVYQFASIWGFTSGNPWLWNSATTATLVRVQLFLIISVGFVIPVISIRWFSFDSKQDSCNFLKFHDNISILISSTFYWFMIIYCSKIEKRRPMFSFHWFHELYVRCQMSKLTCDWPIWMLYACHFQTSKWRPLS